MSKYLDGNGVSHFWSRIEQRLLPLHNAITVLKNTLIKQQKQIQSNDEIVSQILVEHQQEIEDKSKVIANVAIKNEKCNENNDKVLSAIAIEHEERIYNLENNDISSSSGDALQTSLDVKRFFTNDIEDQGLFLGFPTGTNIEDFELECVKYSKVLIRPNKHTVGKYYGMHKIRNISSCSTYISSWTANDDLFQLKLGTLQYIRNGFSYYKVLGKVISTDNYSQQYVGMLQYINTPHTQEDDYFLPINYKNENDDYMIPAEFFKHRKLGIVVKKDGKQISGINTFRTQYDENHHLWKMKVARGNK